MRTPNVDRLAREGMKFTRAFAATPVCSPSRMTWLTGMLPSGHGVQDWLLPKDAFGPESRRWLEGKTGWSDVLAKHGYTLGMTGKWHMGQDERAQSGFSYWATVPGGFNAAQSNPIVDMRQCPLLLPELFALIAPLRELLATIAQQKRPVKVKLQFAPTAFVEMAAQRFGAVRPGDQRPVDR